jgi:hypothetical protein
MEADKAEVTRSITRYARDKKGNLKNTLVAFILGDEIYFGIARCRMGMDTFCKKQGRRTAMVRAQKMIKEIEKCKAAGEENYDLDCNSNICVHFSGLRGHLKAADWPVLKEYFFSLEDEAKKLLHI